MRALPRLLPGLMRDATAGGWDLCVTVRDDEVQASFARDGAAVDLLWGPHPGGTISLLSSTINHRPTPYPDCAALLRARKETS